jgi:cystathionine beta-synthase
MEVYDSVLDVVGGTPLVRLSRLGRGLAPTLLGKVEYLNPGGSVKDRSAWPWSSGPNAPASSSGGTIVEPTSGNTGAGLAIVAALKGYRCVFVMPDKMSQGEDRPAQGLRGRGRDHPDGGAADSPESYYSVANRLTEEIPGAVQAQPVRESRQPRGPLRQHRPRDLGPDRRGGRIFRGRIGTGGTISGAGRYLKERNPDWWWSGPTPRGRSTPPTTSTPTCWGGWGRTSGPRPSTASVSTGT